MGLHHYVAAFDQTTFGQQGGERSDDLARPIGAGMERLRLDPYVLMRIDTHP